MKNEEILKLAIEKAEKNGFKNPYKLLNNREFRIVLIDDNAYFNLIFSHDFAKAFWGDCTESKYVGWNPAECENLYADVILWEYHLQQMVLEEDPIKYLEQFLDN